MGQHPLTHDPCDSSNNGDPCDPWRTDPSPTLTGTIWLSTICSNFYTTKQLNEYRNTLRRTQRA